MRIKIYIAGVLGLIIVLVVALIPWVDGNLLKKQYIKMLSSQPNVKLVEYHQGWLTSTAKISVSTYPDSSDKSKSEVAFTLDEEISHGPFVFDTNKSEWVSALGMIKSRVHISPLVDAMLLGKQGVNEGVVEVDTLMKYNGDSFNLIKSPVFTIQLPTTQMIWHGINGDVEVQVKNGYPSSVKSDITLGALSAQDKSGSQGSFATQDISIKGDVALDPTGLWNGNSQILVPGIALQSNDTNFKINNMTISQNFNVVATNYNSKIQLALGGLATQYITLLHSDLAISFENLNAPTAAKMMQVLRTQDVSDMMVSQDKIMDQLEKLVPQLITKTTIFKENANITTPDGRLLSDGSVSWPNAATTIDDVLKNLTATMNVRISTAVVDQLIKTAATYSDLDENNNENSNASAEDMGSTIVAEPTVTPGVATADSLNKQINDWVDQNQLGLEAGIRLKDLIQTQMNAPSFKTNVDQLVALKEVPANLGNQLTTEYTSMMAAKPKTTAATASAAKAAAPVAPPPKPLTPEEKMHQQIDNIVKSGFVTVENGDYVTTITVNDGVVKANGKVIQ